MNLENRLYSDSDLNTILANIRVQMQNRARGDSGVSVATAELEGWVENIGVTVGDTGDVTITIVADDEARGEKLERELVELKEAIRTKLDGVEPTRFQGFPLEPGYVLNEHKDTIQLTYLPESDRFFAILPVPFTDKKDWAEVSYLPHAEQKLLTEFLNSLD